MSPTTTRPRRTLRQLIAEKDPATLAGFQRIAARIRESLEAVADLQPGHDALEGEDPAEIRKLLERAWGAPAALRPEPAETDAAVQGPDATTWKRHWKRQLNRLKGLPLLAVGAGPDRKAPANLRNGELLGGWQATVHTPAQIESAHKRICGAGTRTGKAADGLLLLDVDGGSALRWLLERGCDPIEARTWQIHRNTDIERLKVAWRLSEDQQAVLGQLKTKVETAAAVKDSKGKVLRKGQAVELFHGVGQVVVLGEHPTSKGFYWWPLGMGPEELAPIPPRWWEAVLQIAQPAEAPAHAAAKKVSNSSKGVWRRLERCPICGRNERQFCSIHRDGKTIRCFHGSTFNPVQTHGALRSGQEISDLQGTVWAFSREQQSAGETFSIFVTPDPERHQQLPAAATPAASLQPAAAAADQAVPGGPQQAPPSAPAPAAGGSPGRTGLAWLLDRLDTGSGPAGARKTTAGDLAQSLMLVAGNRLRFNQQTLLAEIDNQPIEGTSLDTLHVELQLRGMNITAENTVAALATAALQRPYHPVREYLDRVAADPAIEPLDLTALAGRFLRPGDPAGTLQGRMLAKTLIGAVARAFQPGCKLDTACVLVGEQGALKSSFWQELAGPAFYSCSSLGALDKDALLLVHSAWFLEAAELETITSRRAAGELKGFLSTAVFNFRVPYGRTITRRPRGSVVVGTSNRDDFLTDETGSRRFWIIRVTAPEIDVEGVRALRDRIWKSAVLAYRRGERWWLDKADAAASEQENRQFAAGHPWDAPVAAWLEKRGNAPFSTAEGLVQAGLRQPEQIHRRDEMALATVMAGLGWVQRRVQHGRARQRMWLPAADASVPNLPDLPNLGAGEVGQRDRLQRNDSQACAQPARPEIEDQPEAVPVGGSDTQHGVSREKRSGTLGTARESSHRKGSGCPTCPVEVGQRLGTRPEVGHEAPSTTREWVELALAELRLAPDPRYLQQVHGWLQRHPAAPVVTKVQLGDALERLRQEDADDDQQTLLNTP